MKRKLTRLLLFRLWSILMSSCRQFVGTLADPEKKEPPALEPSVNTPVGLGISASRAAPLGSTGTWFPANGKPVAGLIGQSALEPVATLGHKSLKFPCRSVLDG